MLHKIKASYYKVQKQKLPQKLQDILQLKSSIYKYTCSLNSQNKRPKALKKYKKVIIFSLSTLKPMLLDLQRTYRGGGSELQSSLGNKFENISKCRVHNKLLK